MDNSILINDLRDQADANDFDEVEGHIIPIMAETLRVGKRRVVTGRVRIVKTIQTHDEIVDEPLARIEADVKRVPIDRLVDEAPVARQEGETWIVPVVEEVLVVQRRLRLVEEIHITQRQSEHNAPQTITLRREEVSIEHLPAIDIPPSV